MFDPRPLCCSSLTTAVGGTKDTNIVDFESPYRGTNQMAPLLGSQLVAQLVPEMLPIGLKTLGPGFESLGRRKELSGNEDIL